MIGEGKKKILCVGLGASNLGGGEGAKADRVPKPLRPGRQGTGSPLHPGWQRRRGRRAVLPAWHRGAPLSPARLSCASSPHPAPAIQPRLPRAWWLWESGERQGAAFAVAGTPPSGQRGKGERGQAQVLGGSQRCRLGCLALQACVHKGLGSLLTGVTACQSQYCPVPGVRALELCSVGLEKCSRLVTTAFS